MLHRNIATEGVRAGHKILSKLGFGFEISIIVTPVDTGGGGWRGDIPDINEYHVTVVITRKGKKWSQSFEANWFGIKSLEKIILTFKGINKIVDSITFAITSPMINIRNIIVKARKK